MEWNFIFGVLLGYLLYPTQKVLGDQLKNKFNVADCNQNCNQGRNCSCAGKKL
jgi:hypothetical protein